MNSGTARTIKYGILELQVGVLGRQRRSEPHYWPGSGPAVEAVPRMLQSAKPPSDPVQHVEMGIFGREVGPHQQPC